MDLETEVKPRLLYRKDPRVWFLTDLEHGLIQREHMNDEVDCKNVTSMYLKMTDA